MFQRDAQLANRCVGDGEEVACGLRDDAMS